MSEPSPAGEPVATVLRGRSVLLFDLDGTLYDAGECKEFLLHVDRITGRRVRAHYGVESDEAAFQALVDDQRCHGLPSKTATLESRHGITPAQMNRYREEHTRPEDYLRADPELREMMERLRDRFTLVLGTNNTPMLCRRILAVLGIPPDLFELVVSSEDAGYAKPHRGFFLHLLRNVPGPPGRWVSIGDRKSSDLDPAAALGMGTWHVKGRADLLALG